MNFGSGTLGQATFAQATGFVASIAAAAATFIRNLAPSLQQIRQSPPVLEE